MTKQEFIESLSNKLSEELPAEAVLSEVRYYEGYIDGEVAKGRPEEAAVAELGEPILIARNILESPHEGSIYGNVIPDAEDAYYEGSFEAGGGEAEDDVETVRGTVHGADQGFMKDEDGGFNWNLLGLILGIILIVMAVVWLITKIVVGLFPVIVIVIAVSLIVRAVRGSGN